MAVRFSASGQQYTRTVSLGTQSAYTIACWAKIVVDQNVATCLVGLDDGTTTDWAAFGLTDDGTTLTHFDDGNGAGSGSIALTVGTWYFTAVVMNGTSGTVYAQAEGSTTMTSAALTGYSANINLATVRLGVSVHASDWLNGDLTGVRLWTAALTQAELANEARQLLPYRRANLAVAYPLASPELTDYSGNARTLSGGSGVTQDTGPGVPWQADRVAVPHAEAVNRSANW